MSRCLTLSMMYVCMPSRCVCTQFCCVRHPIVSICEPRIKTTWIGVFFILLCWPSPSSICFCCFIIVVKCSWGLGSYSWQSIDKLLLWNLVSWRKRRKSNKKLPQRSRYKDEIPDFLFAEGLEKRRKSKKKKSQRSRYKDEIPVFISRLTGIECTTQKNKKTYAVLQFMDYVYIMWSYSEAKIKILIFWWFYSLIVAVLWYFHENTVEHNVSWRGVHFLNLHGGKIIRALLFTLC